MYVTMATMYVTMATMYVTMATIVVRQHKQGFKQWELRKSEKLINYSAFNYLYNKMISDKRHNLEIGGTK